MSSLEARATELLSQLTSTAGSTWRDGQFPAIQAIVEDRARALVVQRTGWGKSAVYLIATRLIRDRGGGPTVIVARGAGWWMNQYREKPPNNFTTAELLCYLEIVKFMSGVFDEARGPLDTRADAVDILFVNLNNGSANELFDRTLLMTWLNFANGVVDVDTPVDTDGDAIADTTFAAVVTQAETVRLDPGATREEILEQKDILEDLFSG